MAEMSPRVVDLATESRNSRYTRMIPGSAAGTVAGSVRNAHLTASPNLNTKRANPAGPFPGASRPRNWTDFLWPRIQTDDRLRRYQSAAVDLFVVLSSCLLPSILFRDWSLPRLAVPAYAVLFFLLTFNEGLYKTVGLSLAEELPILVRASFCAMALVLVALWNDTQPIGAIISSITSVTALVLCRQIRRKWWVQHRPTEPRNVLLIGAGPIARALANALRDDPFHATNVVGFLDNHVALSPQVLGRVSDLDWLARAQFIDEVIIAISDEPAVLREVVKVALGNHLDIRVVPDLPPGPWPEAGVERIGGIPVITLHRETLPCVTLFLKRVLDVAGAIVGLTLIAPVMGLLALLVRLDSTGPIFYAAQRAGTKGRPFRCYKFRSMTTDADQQKDKLRDRNQREGPIFKLVDDPRITRLGAVLRRYSFDELPQLWNVLRGDMSLVGPRPHPVDEVNRYQLHHYRRLDMKPGITGLWQITARNDPSFKLNMHLDLAYIENWNLTLDLRILISTMRVLVAPEGA